MLTNIKWMIKKIKITINLIRGQFLMKMFLLKTCDDFAKSFLVF